MIRNARPSDVPAVHRLFAENRSDPSLFQQSSARIASHIDAFRVVEQGGEVIACVCISRWTQDIAEIYGVAVHPSHQRRGVGSRIIEHALIELEQTPFVWLGTRKPEYFARLGFRRMSRWRLPVWLLASKLLLVFGQPPTRWLSAIFGGHVFMQRVANRRVIRVTMRA